MVVSFTYTADRSRTKKGKIENPYIAVWIENADGELVDTIALLFLQHHKKENPAKWLPDLRRWYNVDGSNDTVDTISSATRAPGDYSVVWDGTDSDGSLIPQGDYFISIESVREKGRYSLIREPIQIIGDAFAMELPDQGELNNASIEIIVG